MNWLAFAASLVGMLCALLLWRGIDEWIQRRAPRLRVAASGLLFLLIAAPGVWILPNQSKGIFFAAMTGLWVAVALDEVRRRKRRRRATT